MNYIEIDLTNPESISNYDRVAGKQGESNTKGVKFVIPSEYSDWSTYVETENANGEARRYSVNRDKNNVAVYKFRKKDLEAKGRLLLDLVLEKGDMVFKPFSGEFAVKFAICATDDGFGDIDVDLTGYALKTDIYDLQSQISSIPKFTITVVDTLPSENINNTTVYLVKSNTIDSNLYTEYIYVNNTWEILGGQRFDLTNYRKSDESIPASDISYEHYKLSDNSGTLKGSLDEAVEFIVDTVAPSVHTHLNKDTLDNIENIFVKKDNISTEIETALTKAKESGEFKGDPGENGYTPEKGTDYFTEADKAELVTAVLAQLPKAEEDEF